MASAALAGPAADAADAKRSGRSAVCCSAMNSSCWFLPSVAAAATAWALSRSGHACCDECHPVRVVHQLAALVLANMLQRALKLAALPEAGILPWVEGTLPVLLVVQQTADKPAGSPALQGLTQAS